jgi:hypothetical protein
MRGHGTCMILTDMARGLENGAGITGPRLQAAAYKRME